VRCGESLVRAEDRGLECWNGRLYRVSRHNLVQVAGRRFHLKNGKQRGDQRSGNEVRHPAVPRTVLVTRVKKK
jgi:hypothetical protein